MSAIISALDTVTKKKLGENAHVEYGWSHQLREKIVQFYFQLVRCSNHDDLERQLNDILYTFTSPILEHLCPSSDSSSLSTL